jgi:hypothetical protein
VQNAGSNVRRHRHGDAENALASQSSAKAAAIKNTFITLFTALKFGMTLIFARPGYGESAYG